MEKCQVVTSQLEEEEKEEEGEEKNSSGLDSWMDCRTVGRANQNPEI